MYEVIQENDFYYVIKINLLEPSSWKYGPYDTKKEAEDKMKYLRKLNGVRI